MRAPYFPNLDGLMGLARNDGVDIRPTLLRVLTDLYVQRPTHSPEEERHYTELALRLIEVVDAPIRASIAVRLARHPAPPLPVIRRLARDVLEVAQPILAQAPGLTQRELLAIAQERGSKHAAVIANRAEFVQAARADRPAPETATPPVRTPAQELCELFFSADAAERRLILLNLDFAPLPLAAPIAPSLAQEASRGLETAALAGRPEDFAQALERALAIARAHAKRIATDQSGEPVVVAAKALVMSPDMLQRVLLFLNPAIGQSVQRVYELVALHEEITPASVLRLLALWRESAPASAKPAHQPHLSPERKELLREAAAQIRRIDAAPPERRRIRS